MAARALKTPKLANGLCCFWLFAGFFSLIGFTVSAAILVVGIVTNDSCGLLDGLFTTTGLSTYSYIFPTNTVNYLNACFNDYGNIDSILGINNSLSFLDEFKSIESNLLTFPIDESLANFKSIDDNFQQISYLVNYLGIAAFNVVSENTPDYNIIQLNSYTNKNTQNNHQSSCSKFTYDNWVFNQSNCESYSYVASSNPTQSLGAKSCLVINEWTDTDVESRYNNYLVCSDLGEFGTYLQTIQSYQTALKAYQNSVTGLYLNLIRGMMKIQANLNSETSDIIIQNSKIIIYFNSENGINPLISETIGPNGLLNLLNCSFVSPYSTTLKDSMCNNSVQSTYQIFVYIFILSFLLLILELVNLYLSRALLKKDPKDL